MGPCKEKEDQEEGTVFLLIKKKKETVEGESQCRCHEHDYL
jgi:hypothetical protein